MSDYLIKLVRDRIEESFEHDAHDIVFGPLDKETHVKLLRQKLLEEAAEYLLDPSLSEAGDILETLRALAVVDLGKSWGDVEAAADDKREQRGGFEEGVGMFAREVR